MTSGSIRVEHGDCLEVLPALAAEGVLFDAVVTDPPYHLTSIHKRYGTADSMQTDHPVYKRHARGFMGKGWDGGDVAFRPETWALVFAVMKPGAHLVAFGGTRTYHRMTCAIEDAGFEIRDTLAYMYGSGFPKSHNISKAAGAAICRCPAGNDHLRGMRQGADASVRMGEEGEAPDMLAPMQRRPARGGVESARAQGSIGADGGKLCDSRDAGGEQSGLEGRRDFPAPSRELRERPICEVSAGPADDGESGRLCDGAPVSDGAMDRQGAPAGRVRSPCRSRAAEQPPGQSGTLAGQPEPQAGGAWPVCGGCGKPIVPDGLGTALKPAFEPIILARKPLIGTVAANVLQHGTGALNIDGCRVATNECLAQGSRKPGGNFDDDAFDWPGAPGQQSALGRWPANVVHDGSDEVLAAFPDAPGQQARLTGNEPTANGFSGAVAFSGMKARIGGYEPRGDSGSAARFFYSAKADADDRAGSKHPTVKPLDLMRWLCRLVTPPGGLILDPFAGSGTTGEAARLEGFRAILIEREAEYVADIRRRLGRASGDDTPLFLGAPAK